MKRKILTSVILAIVCLCTLTVFCSADTHDGFVYTVQKGEAIITGYTGSTGSLTIPATLNGYPVVGIADAAFKNNEDITMVTISKGIISIGDQAFFGCESLMVVVIPASVTSIGDDAFAFCSKLASLSVNSENTAFSADGSVLFNFDKTELIQYPIGKTAGSFTIPETVTTVADNAFAGASKLKAVTVPASVTAMTKDAFEFCGALTNITVNEGNPNFASVDGVLYNKAMTSLLQYPLAKADTTYEIPATVTSIDDWAFGNCAALESVIIPDSVEKIGYAAFANCEGLTAITIPGTATVGELAFGGCTALESVDMTEGVTSIGMAAFSGCTALKNVTISSAVATIGEMNPATGKYIGAFGNCTALESFTVSEDNAYFCAIDGNLFNKAATEIIKYAVGKTDAAYVLPATVSTVASEAFAGASNLEIILLSGALRTIGDDAFRECTALTDLNIPDGVTYIGLYAFADCTSLENVTVPSTVQFIGAYAFSGCDSLAKAKVYTQTPVIGTTVFRDSGSDFVLHGCVGSSVEEYAVANSYAFRDITKSMDVTVDNLSEGVLVVTPEYGWCEGENTFTVYSGSACVVLISYDGGTTYTRLPATLQEDGGYSFTADDVADGVIFKITKAGDINGDGAFTNADATLLKAAVLGKTTLDSIGDCLADINGDGKFSNADVTRLKAIWLGKVQPKW